MKRIDKLIYQAIFGLALIFAAAITTQAGVISPQLQSTLQNITPDSEISVIVTFSDRADISKFKQKDRKIRRSLMIRALRQKAEQTQAPCRAFLKNKKAKRLKKLWLINGLAFKAKANVIMKLANMPGIESIKLDGVVSPPATILGVPSPVEWNIDAINATQLWDLGYTGQGIVVANMDTGVDVTHPDLASRWRGGTNSWLDLVGLATTPYDSMGHGTQTMGLMVGGDVSGKSIGVAHGSQWIAVRIFDPSGATYTNIHLGFQWLLDPDGDPNTDDAPHVVNNSWSLENMDNCSNEFQPDVQALKAAGIAVVFAAGNSGPIQSSESPGNYPEGYATGAVDFLNNIASFSGRGPSSCDNSIYPEVVAPGVNIKLADTSYGLSLANYTFDSGTSFASPHVAGAMALLLGAFPDITIAELEFALDQSALDLGAPGPDNDYGNGLIDVFAAYNLISANTANEMIAVGDVNVNGTEDMAVLWIDPFAGTNDVYVKEGSDGSLIRKVVFNANYEPVDLVVIPDMNSNGSPEIGMLGVHAGAGTVRVQIKDSVTGEAVKSIYFSNESVPQQVELIPDSDGDGECELGVLGVNATTGAVRVQIKNTLTNDTINRFVPFSKNFTPVQFAVIQDISGNVVSELGVLGVEVSTGAVRVQINDAFTGNKVKNVHFSQNYLPYQMEVMPDMDSSGTPELALLCVSINTGDVRVHIKDSFTGLNVSKVYFTSSYTPYQFGILSDTNGNLIPDIGMLEVQEDTGEVRAVVRDASSGAWLKNVLFDKVYAPQKMAVVNDMNANNMSEIAVLGKDRITGNVQVQINDSLTRATIVTIPIP